MREVSLAALRDEIQGLRGAVSLVRIHHFSGAKLLNAGCPVTSQEIQALQQSSIASVFFADGGEGELEAQRTLSTQIVDLSDLAIGDVLVDNIFGLDGEILCPPGTFVDAPILEGEIKDLSGPVTIRKRGMKGGPEQANSFLALAPKYPPHPARPDTGLTLASDPAPKPLRPILAPRARVLVTLADSFQRSLLMNVFAAEGHEVIDRRWADVSQAEFQRSKFDVVVLDLADAPGAVPLLRKSDVFRQVSVLVTAPEGRRSEVYKALTQGANGSLPMPFKRDVALERLHSTVQAFGRRVKLKPAVVQERRQSPREGGHMLCTLQDKFLSTPLPVKEATLLDVTDSGLRIEYRRPPGPVTHAYLAHGVHPQHFFFNYAKDNPLGRDVTVSFPQAGGRNLEGHAKFVHLSFMGDFEVAGLALQRMKSSVREHMTAVRGGTARLKPSTQIGPLPGGSTTRRSF
jgi:DNA-binding response OmpR family regulator